MANTLKCLSPVAYLTNSAADIYTPPASTIETIIRHIRLVNVTGGAVTYTLYIGATGGSAGGTEIAKAISIPANGTDNIYFPAGRVMKSTDFLSGLASASTSITIEVNGEQKVVD